MIIFIEDPIGTVPDVYHEEPSISPQLGCTTAQQAIKRRYYSKVPKYVYPIRTQTGPTYLQERPLSLSLSLKFIIETATMLGLLKPWLSSTYSYSLFLHSPYCLVTKLKFQVSNWTSIHTIMSLNNQTTRQPYLL